MRTFRTGDFVFKKKKAAQKQICSAAAFLQTGQGKEDLKRNLVFAQLPKSDQRFIFQNSQLGGLVQHNPIKFGVIAGENLILVVADFTQQFPFFY